MLRGGLSDKLGNGYEALWAVAQAVRVLRGDLAASLKVEPIGEGRGFEFVVDTDAAREWHQCKINGARGNWTIAALHREGFFGSVAAKAKADPAARFVFVSTDPAADLKLLAQKAARTESFGDFLLSLAEAPKQQENLSRVVAHLNGDTKDFTQEQCWTLLRRIRIEIVSEASLREQVASELRYLILRDPDGAGRAIKESLELGLTQTLTTERLRTELNAAGYQLRDAMLDVTVRQNLADQNHLYAESHGELGLDGAELPRATVEDIVAAVRDASVRMIVVTGVAGVGKSGVLRLATAALQEDTDCLIIRIDRLLDVGASAALGELIFHRPESPCRTLSHLARNRTGLIVIDQLDAVSEVAGRQAKARDLVSTLIRETERLPNLKIILACREYDYANDRRFRTWAQTESSRHIRVELLGYDAEVLPYLDRLGLGHLTPSAAQREVLRLPLNLILYARLAKQGVPDLAAATTTAALFELLLREKNRELRDRVPWSVEEPLGVMARWMSDHARLDAPAQVLGGHKDAHDVLISAHLVTEESGRLRFFHESLFDYAFAGTFLRSGASLTDWLVADEQVLFRRTQVRQVLELLRPADERAYLRELTLLLTHPRVRPHIKDMVALWLAALPQPTRAELDIVLALDDERTGPHLLVRHALLSPAWAQLLIASSHIPRWLRSTNDDRRHFALRLLDTLSANSPALVAELMRAWWRDQPESYSLIMRWSTLLRTGDDASALVALHTDLVAACPADDIPQDRLPHLADVGHWVHHDSEGAAAVFGAWLARWFEVNQTGHPFEHDHRNDAYWLAELARKQPRAFATAVLPWLGEAFRREAAEGKSEKRYRSAFDLRERDDEDRLHETIDLVREALRSVAKADPDAARTLLAHIDPATHFAALHLHLETIAAANGALAVTLVPLLRLPGLLEAGFDGAHWISAAKALSVSLPHLGNDVHQLLDDWLADYRPELRWASRHLREGPSEHDDPARHKRVILANLNESGEDLRGLLSALGRANLRPRWIARLDELDRKFAGRALPKPFRSRSGIVASPISLEQARRMGDAAWLSAMKKYNSARERNIWSEKGPIGGGDELARVLQQCAKENPERFVGLARQLPSDTYQRYRVALIEGIAESEAPTAIALEAAHIWLGHVPLPDDRDPLPSLVSRKPQLLADDAVFEALARIARKGSVTEDATIDDGDDADDDDPEGALDDILSFPDKVGFRGFVSQRGSAVEAIGSGLWETEARIDEAVALIENVAADDSVSRPIRCCWLHPVHAVIGVDLDRGFALLDRLTVLDPWPLGTRRGIRLVVWALYNRPDIGARLLERVLASSDARLKVTALWMLTIFAHGNDEAAKRLDEILPTSTLARRMAARVAVNNAERSDVALAPRTLEWLKRFSDDEDAGVRKEAANAGRALTGPDHEARASLAEMLAASRAFLTSPDMLLYELDDRASEFPRAVITSAKAYFAAEANGDFPKNTAAVAGHLVSKMVLAAYRTLENEPQFRAEALDMVDQLVLRDQIGVRSDLDQRD